MFAEDSFGAKPGAEPEVQETARTQLVAFRLPTEISGPYARFRVLPQPLTFSALHRHATELFNVPRYHVLMMSFVTKYEPSDLMGRFPLLDEADMAGLRTIEKDKALTNPPCCIIDFKKYNKANGELVEPKVTKGNQHVDRVGPHVKLDHPGALKFKEKRRLKELELELERLAQEEAAARAGPSSSSRHIVVVGQSSRSSGPGPSSSPRKASARRSSSQRTASKTQQRKSKSSTSKKHSAAKNTATASSSKSRGKRPRRGSVDDNSEDSDNRDHEAFSEDSGEEEEEEDDDDDVDDDDDDVVDNDYLPDIRPKARRYVKGAEGARRS
ncbi:hypothetical protein OC835_002295 [Tilletia horrida]|nr:hypothetical protein OC835_002295 [Tilletia horrida]